MIVARRELYHGLPRHGRRSLVEFRVLGEYGKEELEELERRTWLRDVNNGQGSRDAI
jgi:hypothetical protein